MELPRQARDEHEEHANKTRQDKTRRRCGLGRKPSRFLTRKKFAKGRSATMPSKTVRPNSLRKTYFKMSFSYVCPEPVLVKRSFLYRNGSKSTFSLPTGEFEELQMLQENGTFSEVSLCLSRACLGKMMHFYIKSGQKVPFSYLWIDRGFLAWIHPLVLLCVCVYIYIYI
eukprot:COSAG06_NODE_5497_length_3442_cov_3.036195_3_plen_170_part_00